jgi:arsenite methyltransferase
VSGPVPDALDFDEQTSLAVEAVYSTPDVVEQRREILRVLDLKRGERVLDLGCGPGYLANEMAAVVGSGGRVEAIDVSDSMLAIASRRQRPHGAAPVELSKQDATSLSFADGSFDAAVSTQVYEYVADMDRALDEARRVLTPGGRLAILDTDWDSIVWRSSDDDRMQRVLRAWDEHLVHRDLPRRLPELLRGAGFSRRSAEVVPLLNIGYEPETYSARVAPMIAHFVAGRQDIRDDEANAWLADLQGLGSNYFFSLNRYLFLAST